MNALATRDGAVKIALVINNFDDMRAFCKVLCGTEMVPKAYRGKADDALVSIMHGQEIGLPPLQALQSIAVINGVPSIYGDAALAMVRSSGFLANFDEWLEVDGQRIEGPVDVIDLADKQNKKVVAHCLSGRSNMQKERHTWFSVDDAKRARLWLKKGYEGKETPWCTVPQRMLMWRARGWNLRDNFGDVLKGLAIYEEVMDIEPTPDMPSGGKVEAPVGMVPSPAGASPSAVKAASILSKVKTGGRPNEIEGPKVETLDVPAKVVEPELIPAKPVEEKNVEPSTVEPLTGEVVSANMDELEANCKDLFAVMSMSGKGIALLNGIKKDFKVKPEAIVPSDAAHLPLYYKALKLATEKMKGGNVK